MTKRKKEEKKCIRHDWRVGSYIGLIHKSKDGSLKFEKIGINIFCSKCKSKLRAFYNHRKL